MISVNMNESKKTDLKMWEKWRKAGALGHEANLFSHRFDHPLRMHYEEDFKGLQSEIMESLKPGSALIIFSTDIQDPPNGYHVALDQKGRWSLGFGREGMGYVKLPEVLKSFAFAKQHDLLFSPTDDLFFDHKIEIEEYARKRMEIRRSLNKSVDEDPIFFANHLLGNMVQALQRYRENPY